MTKITGPEPISLHEQAHRRVSLDLIRNSPLLAFQVPRGQKDPGGTKDWDPKNNNKEKSERALRELENNHHNIAGHLSGPVIDVDIDGDSPALQRALDAFLPPCSHIWGRASRPRTHRLYQLRDADFDPSAHPILYTMAKIPEVKVEVRGGPLSRGRYSILPGSLHPSGELYEWSDLDRAKSSISVTTIDHILRAIRMAGAVAVLAPYWQEGMRNDLNRSLSGLLYRAYMAAESLGGDAEGIFYLDRKQARHFLETLYEVLDDDPSDRSARLATFERTWDKAEAGGAVTAGKTLDSLTGDAELSRKLYLLLTQDDSMRDIDWFVENFAIWQGPGVVIDMRNVGVDLAPMRRDAFNNSYAHMRLSGGKLISDLLFTLKHTQRVTGITFDPSQDARIVETDTGPKVNQWTGFRIAPFKAPVSSEEIQPFIDYLKDVICGREPHTFPWVLAWIADIFQRPAEKPGTALVLHGKPGAGKTFLGEQILRPIIGKTHSTMTNSLDHLVSGFNAMFDNKLFVQCDEATNNRQRASTAKLKSIITDEEIRIEHKGVNAVTKPNHFRLLFTSNDSDALHISDGSHDRRFMVIEVSDARLGQESTFWRPFHAWLNEPGTFSKIHRFLLDHEYDPDMIRRPVHTAAKVVMQHHSSPTFDSWLLAWVSRGHPLSEHFHRNWYDAPIKQAGSYNQEIDRTEWPKLISYPALAEDYRSFIRSRGTRGEAPLNEQQIRKELVIRGLIPEDAKASRLRVREYDPRSQKYLNLRPRLHPCPEFSVLKKYLIIKFGDLMVDNAPEEDIDLDDLSFDDDLEF